MTHHTDEYIESVLEHGRRRNEGQSEFIQSTEEVLRSIALSLERHPEYRRYGVLERLLEPERQIMFRIGWEDDQGKIQVNRGYNILFHSILGPFKGGLRFHPTVSLSVVKFLAFEQTFKNALTGLPIGGGKGGSDFDPRGKSEAEVRRFCESFMMEMYRHMDSDTDVPAGDIGVGGREIGYLFGTYRRLMGNYDNGAITGKGTSFGGSSFRPGATGYGIAYFCDEILHHFGESFEGKTVLVSGYGQVAWGTIRKITELGGRVVTLSGSDGFVHDPEGITTEEKMQYIDDIKNRRTGSLKGYAEKFGAVFHEKEKPWNIKADIAIPCATQNEIGLAEAKTIAANGVRYLVEGANMPCTNEAVEYFQAQGIVVGPAKAANAGGVSVSVLEMSQNSMKVAMTDEEMDARLKTIMKDMHTAIIKTCENYDLGYDLVTGSNITGFERVADAMVRLGIY